MDPSTLYILSRDNQIGSGGFGKVFKVRRRSDGMVCAMKFCNPKDEKEKNMIVNEIGLMNQCRANPNVLKIYNSYDYRDRIWIFLELMDSDLYSLIAENHKIYSEQVVKYILRKVLEGLANLHSLKIIHRDIKSDNVLISAEGGHVKLADFGFSCRLQSEEELRQSQVGTVAWMAPELIRGKRVGYDTSIDIWSYGILAVELANGDPPNINKN